MALPIIIVKATSAVNATGPGGSAARITFSVDDHEVHAVTLINDGPDPINYFFNTSGALPTFATDSFTLKINNSIQHIFHGLDNLFMICDTAKTASVRYLVERVPGTNKNHII